MAASKVKEIFKQVCADAKQVIYDKHYCKILLDEYKKSTIEMVGAIKTQSEQELFYAELSSWAAGMANPKHLTGSKRTEAIRGFFRGMKRKK